MLDVPIELFFGFIGLSLVLVIIGLAREPKIPALIVFAGMFILPMVLITDNLIMGHAVGNLEVDITDVYDIITTTATQTLRTGNFNTHGEYASTSQSRLVGMDVNCATIPLAKSNSPDFNTPIIFAVFDSSTAGNIKYEFGRMNVTILTTSTQFFKLCNNDQTYTIVAGDTIGVRWNDGDVTNNIFTRNDQTNPYDGTISYQRSYNPNTPAWTDFTANDMTMILTLESGESIQEITPITFQFTEFLKTIFALYAVILMLVGALITKMGIN